MKISIALTSGQLSGAPRREKRKRIPPLGRNSAADGKRRRGRAQRVAGGAESVVVFVAAHAVYSCTTCLPPLFYLPRRFPSPGPYGNALKLTLVFQSRARRLHPPYLPAAQVLARGAASRERTSPFSRNSLPFVSPLRASRRQRPVVLARVFL